MGVITTLINTVVPDKKPQDLFIYLLFEYLYRVKFTLQKNIYKYKISVINVCPVVKIKFKKRLKGLKEKETK